MKREQYQNRIELVQGTLDMLILQTLCWGSQHGYGISQAIRCGSEEILQVETGSLYPALHRLERQGWVKSEWKQSENKQRAKILQLDAIGPEASVRRAEPLESSERGHRRLDERPNPSNRRLIAYEPVATMAAVPAWRAGIVCGSYTGNGSIVWPSSILTPEPAGRIDYLLFQNRLQYELRQAGLLPGFRPWEFRVPVNKFKNFPRS